MKKVMIASLLILALCLSLVACGSSTPAEDPTVPEETLDPNSIGGKLAALGFKEQDFLLGSQDHIEINEEGDYVLYSSASYEEVARATYNACKKAADDGEVRDYWSEEPIEFSFNDDFMIWFGYNRNGEFKDVALSETWTNEETGMNEYLLQWE